VFFFTRFHYLIKLSQAHTLNQHFRQEEMNSPAFILPALMS